MKNKLAIKALYFSVVNQIHMGRILVLVVFILCISIYPCQSQGFKAAAIVGMNASQIDGDNLYGFNKIGITAGARLSYSNNKIYDFSLEMLYSQRGSAVKAFTSDPNQIVGLNYFEFPMIFSLRDWYIEDGGFYKVRVDAGVSYGYLFGINSPTFKDDYFRRHDVSYLLGVGLNVTKRLGFSLRYTSSLFNMYKDPTLQQSSLLGYFLTLRTEINF